MIMTHRIASHRIASHRIGIIAIAVALIADCISVLTCSLGFMEVQELADKPENIAVLGRMM